MIKNLKSKQVIKEDRDLNVPQDLVEKIIPKSIKKAEGFIRHLRKLINFIN